MSSVVVASDSVPTINKTHRDRMIALEYAIETELVPAECLETHYFAHGIYTRELFIPAGTVLTGKIHRHSCVNILAKGAMRVETDEGSYTITAPHTFTSGPGVKKAGFALEDSIWINVHPWEGAADVALVEAEMILPSYDAVARLEDTE